MNETRLANEAMNDNVSSVGDNVTAFLAENCGEFDVHVLDFFKFWVEGVALVVITIIGLLANVVSMVILNK